MELRRTSRRAERVDALLRGAISAETADDRRTLAVAEALNGWPAPTLRPEFRAALRTRLLSDPDPARMLATARAGGTEADPAQLRAGESTTAEPATAKPRDPAPARTRRRPTGRLVRPVLVGAAACSVAVVGVAVGARGALPGEPLYPVKRQVEQIQVTLAGSDTARARAHLDLARTRMDEMQSLLDTSDEAATQEIPGLLAAWQEEVTSGSDVLVEQAQAGDPEARETMTEFAADQSEDLAVLVEQLPTGSMQTIATQALAYLEDMGSALGTPGGGLLEPAATDSEAGSPTSTPGTTAQRTATPSPATGSPTPTSTQLPSAGPSSASASPGTPVGSAPASSAPTQAVVPLSPVPAPPAGGGRQPGVPAPTGPGAATAPGSLLPATPWTLPTAPPGTYRDGQFSLPGFGSAAVDGE